MNSEHAVFQECKLVIVKVYVAIDLNERAAVHYLHDMLLQIIAHTPRNAHP